MSIAASISAALGGSRSGDGYVCKCPAHNDKNPSLSVKDIRDKKGNPDILVNCQAGCDWKTVKDSLRGMGLIPGFKPTPKKKDAVNFIWAKATKDVDIVKNVFKKRGINIGYNSPAIRINEYKKEKMLVFAMTKPGDDKVLAVQRIPFNSETFEKSGKGKMFGKNTSGENYCMGRGVFFFRKDPVENFIVGEGIETTLSVMQAMDMNGCACLSTSGIKNITLPDGIKKLYILVDSDKSFGGQKAAIDLAGRVKNSVLVTPCDDCFSDNPTKMDFNDILMSGGSIQDRFLSASVVGKINWSPPKKESNNGAYPPETLKELEGLNKTFGAALLSGTFRVLKEHFDGHKHFLSFLKAYDFELFFRNKRVMIEKDDELKPVPLGKLWLDWEGRRTYSSVTFDPDLPESQEGVYNMYRGLLPPKQGDWSKMRWHTKYIICDGDEELFQYVMAWMARAVQDPGGKRPGVAIVLQGGKGIGKGFWSDYMGKMFGEGYLPLADASGFTGRFNMHMSKALLVFLDEATFGGDKKHKGKLQNMITDPVTLFEPKGIDSITMRNYMNVIIASNEEWIIPASCDERRYLVLAVNSDKQIDTKYFNAMDDEMENGGPSAMMYDLLQHDYSGVNLRKAPFTQALSEQIETSLPAVFAFWQLVLERGFLLSNRLTGEPKETLCDDNQGVLWPEEVWKYEVYNEFLDFSDKNKERYIVSNRGFWKFTWQFWPGASPPRRQKRQDGELKDCLALPGKKELKTAFSEHVKVFFDEKKSYDENISFDFGANIE